ncbi:putative alpha,alpha-trehalose-phosphate synthase (UDP-forming) [Helianthus anomalus]
MHVITHTCQKWVETFLRFLEQRLKRLCDDPTSTVVIISGSQRCILEKNFEDYNVWLVAEHGVFIRTTAKNWSQNLTNNIHTDWIASVKVSNWSNGSDDPLFFLKFSNLLLKLDVGCNMFSSISLRELHGLTVSSTRHQSFGVISIQVYFEFGRRQAKDLLNHLRTGIVQGEHD